MDDFITVISLVRYVSGYRTNAYVVAYNAINPITGMRFSGEDGFPEMRLS